MTVRIKGKIWKTGNGYVVTIPKAFMEAGVFEIGQELSMEATVTDSAGAGLQKNEPGRNWPAITSSCLYGLANAWLSQQITGGFALDAV